MKVSQRWLSLAAALVLAVCTAGCGGGKDGTPVKTAIPGMTAEADAAPQPEETADVDEDALLWNEDGEWMGWYDDGSPEETVPNVIMNGDMPTVADEAAWTIMIYLCGTDLESDGGAASINLQEILDAAHSSNVNVVVQTGGTESWYSEGVDPGVLQRFAAGEDAFALADEQPLASMGDPDTLTSFLSWGAQNYPAERYALILWNHGAGSVGGVAFDQLFEDDALTIEELSRGIGNSGVTLEVIGFDACLMATLENASALSSYARYMVASEEYEPGTGWDYTAILDALAAKSGQTGAIWGRTICDTYYQKCADSGEEDMATLSLIDLASIHTLRKAFDAMAAEMTGVTEDLTSLRQLTRGARAAENYGGNTRQEGYTNMVDLGDLVLHTEDVLSGTGENVLNALFRAVVYQVNGSSRSQSNGLSVFYPLSADGETCNAYAAASVSSHYLQFIAAMTGWDASAWVSGASADSVDAGDYSPAFTARVTEDGFYELTLTQDADSVESVLFTLEMEDPESGYTVSLGLDDDIDADWDTGIFRDNFRGVWPTIGGSLCAPQLLQQADAYNLYSIPALLNGEEVNLRASYIWAEDGSGTFKLYGAWEGLDTDTGMAQRSIRKLKAGDVLEFLFSATDENGEACTVSMGEITVTADTRMEELELEDGLYVYRYQITDVFGRQTLTDPVTMEYDKGEIYVREN